MSGFSTLETAVSPTEKFREFLVTKNLKMTREREIIVDEVFSSHEHFEPDDLIARLGSRTDSRRVSRSTVYRTLEKMEEAGLLRKVARPNGREVYEHDYGYPQHDHLICDVCGVLTEFHNDAITRIIEEIATTNGFMKSGHRLEVYGTCETCRQPKQRRFRKLDMI